VPEIQIDINDVASVGVIRDSPPHEIPPEAWTLAENVRFEDDSVVMLLGYSQVFGTPGVAPYFAQYISAPAQGFWLYAGLSKIYVYDGTTHTDITRTTDGATYNAGSAAAWNGTNIGGIPILNDGADVPQFWGAYSPLTHMANLTNWPSTLRCKVIRAFGPYLMALNLTDAGVQKPYDVRWSHPADPGSVPITWDINDPTHDAGQVSLSDVDSGQIVDGLSLQGKFYVYKENSTWRFRNVGGQFIFDEDAFLETTGLLAPRCVAVTGDGQKHFFVGQDNIYLHDGNSAKPLLDKLTRRYLFNQIDPSVSNYTQSFVFINPVRREGWFCYPALGQTAASRAMIVNYETGAMTEADVDWQHAASGTIQTSLVGDSWDAAPGVWTDDTTAWDSTQRRKILLSRPLATKFDQLDLGTTKEGSSFTGLIQRTALGVVGRKRTGEWIEDFEQRKMCHRIWPKMSGSAVQIRLGGQDTPVSSPRWSAPVTFNPNTQLYCDITAEGSALAIEISGQMPWKLDGYKLDLVTNGRF
jgi:hypothetical protein